MSKKLIHLASFVLVFGLCGSAASGQENQIINGEFDEGFDPWGLYTYQNTTEGFTVEVVQGAGLSGENAAVFDITNSSALASIGIAQGDLVIEPGVTYPIGFTARAEQDRGMVVLLQANINNASWPTYLEQTVALTTSPQDYVIEYTHSGSTVGAAEGENLILYLMIKGPWWHPPGDVLNGKVWIDRVYFGTQTVRQPVYHATDPSPPDGAMHLDTWVTLEWSEGDFAASHDVYLGDNFDDVNGGTEETFRGNHPTAGLTAGFLGHPYPDGLVPGTTYYWRIDEVNDLNANSPWKGSVWSFTIPPQNAYEPDPADGVKFIEPDTTLSWTGGLGAALHHVYFGDNLADVEAGAGGTYKGPRPTTSFAPGTLEREKTYYWRVDEFDGAAMYRGDVWSFKTLPDIPITDPNLIGWWKLDEGQGTTALDWSGHGNHATLQGDPEWVEGYDGGALQCDGSGDWATTGLRPADYGLDGGNPKTVTAWVYTTGFNDGGIYDMGSQSDGQEFCLRTLGTVNNWRVQRWGYPTYDFDVVYPSENVWVHFAQVYTGSAAGNMTTLYANGMAIGTQTVELNTANAPFVIGRYGSSTSFNGIIDDLRIYNKALTQEEIKGYRPWPFAWNASPTNRSTPDIDHVLPLSWSPGEKASQHDVYFGTDRDAVDNADTSTPDIYRGRQSATSYTPPEGVEWGGGPYYWRIDEYNTDATISKGRVWNFTVVDFIGIDNIEGYNDEEDHIWYNWLDGLGYVDADGVVYAGNASGSEVGDPNTFSFTEETIVHGGRQSMPYRYNNNKPDKMNYSEAKLTLTATRDWTKHGVKALSLWFYGDPANAPEPMYVAIANSSGTPAVVYHDDPDAAQMDTWTEWNIDLKEFQDKGVNLADVDSIALGFGDRNNPQAGGAGKMYFDDVRLYRSRCVPDEVTLSEADLNSDCVVDYRDLEIMAGDWLAGDPGLAGDLNADDTVDFKDYAVLADQWLEELLWPQP
ncbi:MAG: carbohydrate binding domain-containing protein [Phycisphaerales bacterium]|jgi:hypothetical protein